MSKKIGEIWNVWFVLAIIALLITVVGFGYQKGYIDFPKAVEASKLTLTDPIVEDNLEESYIQWMFDHSSMPIETLEAVYTSVSRYPSRKNIYLAIIKKETSPTFSPHSYSPGQDKCLMQINMRVWKEELIKNNILKDDREVWKIDSCIDSGHYIFSGYLKKCKGDIKCALRKYNGGTKENGYVKSVLQNLGEIYLINIKEKKIEVIEIKEVT